MRSKDGEEPQMNTAISQMSSFISDGESVMMWEFQSCLGVPLSPQCKDGDENKGRNSMELNGCTLHISTYISQNPSTRCIQHPPRAKNLNMIPLLGTLALIDHNLPCSINVTTYTLQPHHHPQAQEVFLVEMPRWWIILETHP